MSTPKPGQIRCPTCLRSTPPAAYCTQCGSPIPASARSRPRGLDRNELEERVRRRPGEAPFRRGSSAEDSAAAAGYVPFQPEPEDSLAKRPETGQPATYSGPAVGEEEETGPVEPPAAVAPVPPPAAPEVEAPQYVPPPPPPADQEEAYFDEPYDDRPYGEPEDAYAYPYAAPVERGGGGGGGALPIIGFVVLCVLALAVGAVLAGLIGGDDGVGQLSPSPSVASAEPTVEPTDEATPAPSESTGEATPEPSDGPVTFADGAIYEVAPCGTYEYRSDLSGCRVDGTTRDSGDVWILVIFDDARGSDTVTLALRQDGSTIDQQEKVLGSLVNCASTCQGLIWGAVYQDLDPGDYELVLRRNGDFADRASFTVEG